VTSKVRRQRAESNALSTPHTVTAREAGEFAVLRAVMQSSTVAGWRTMKNDWEEPLSISEAQGGEDLSCGFSPPVLPSILRELELLMSVLGKPIDERWVGLLEGFLRKP
jgi:hypothetical protein